MGGGCTNGVKQSGLSPVAATCNIGNHVSVSHSANRTEEIGYKHQGHAMNPVEVVVWMTTT